VIDKKTRKSILCLSSDGARQYFLKQESYCTFDLPPYISFQSVLTNVSNILKDKKLNDFHNSHAKPRNFDGVNYTLFSNKGGKYEWRPLQLIHPALYVALIHQITQTDNWDTLKRCFNRFSLNNKIQCLSIPVVSLSKEKDKAEQVSKWWQEIEQKSLKLSLEYNYLIETDISDCYPSIYTHTIAWALHGKPTAKAERDNPKLLGNIIDWYIQDMHNSQTNGIPQGAVLMDFIAEMVLGYADNELSDKIQESESQISDYHILRYRDDYRIFVNAQQDGEYILKLLTEIMIDLGLKLNPNKTKINDRVIKASIKEDKLVWITSVKKGKNLQENLLIIYNHSIQFPNSGSVIKELSNFNKTLCKILKMPAHTDVKVLLAITVDIAFHNPKCYPVCFSIISNLLHFIDDDNERENIVLKIKEKFANIPNTGYMEIWLQRISLPYNLEFSEPICKLVKGEDIILWNTDWINSKKLKVSIMGENIVDNKRLKETTPRMSQNEVSLFTYGG
jgi:hypothetical protein